MRLDATSGDQIIIYGSLHSITILVFARRDDFKAAAVANLWEDGNDRVGVHQEKYAMKPSDFVFQKLFRGLLAIFVQLSKIGVYVTWEFLFLVFLKVVQISCELRKTQR